MSLISTSTLQIVCYNSQSRCNQFNTDPEKISNPAQNEIQPSNQLPLNRGQSLELQYFQFSGCKPPAYT